MSAAKTEAQRRKEQPMANGLLAYFPRACAYTSGVSYVGNEQHNPGQPMHWAMGKSIDHLDCLVRHLTDHLKGAPVDTDQLFHLGKVMWRAAAALEVFLWATELGMPSPEKVTGKELEAELNRRKAAENPPADLRKPAENLRPPPTSVPGLGISRAARLAGLYAEVIGVEEGDEKFVCAKTSAQLCKVGDVVRRPSDGALTLCVPGTGHWELVAHRPADCPADYVPAKVVEPWLNAPDFVWISPSKFDPGFHDDYVVVWPEKSHTCRADRFEVIK